tara:strand:+ start:536 stop:1702 length:1167 start_codon:yes stop_codon:yes gene_type:complete
MTTQLKAFLGGVAGELASGGSWKYYVDADASTDPSSGSNDDEDLYIIHPDSDYSDTLDADSDWTALGSGKVYMSFDIDNKLNYFKLDDIACNDTSKFHSSRNTGVNRSNQVTFVLADNTTATFANINIRWQGPPAYIGSSSSSTGTLWENDSAWNYSEGTTSGGGGGGSGDPYITTLSGITYKMDDFTGVARMLQGMYQDKLFTLNVSTQLLNSDEIHELIEYRKQCTTKRTFSENAEFASFPAYFKKLFVSWGDEWFIMDMNTLVIEESNYEVQKTIEQKDVQEYSWSKKKSPAFQANISIGKMVLSVNTFSNKDIRNGFYLTNIYGLTDRSGALENTIFTKDMKRRSLRSIIPITQRENRVSNKTISEEYMEKHSSEKRTITHNIF